MNYIIIVGVFQALTALGLAAFVSVKKTDDRDGVLSLLLAAILLHLGGNFILNVFFPYSEIHKQFNTFLGLLYPVLLWCYARRLSGFRREWERRDLLHFVPAGFSAVCYLSIAGYTITHQGKTPGVIGLYNSVSGYMYIALYTVYSLRCLRELCRIPSFWSAEKRFVTFASALFLVFAVYMLFLTVFIKIYPSLWTDLNLHLWSRIILYSFLLLICLSAALVKVHALYILQADTAAGNPLPPESEPVAERTERAGIHLGHIETGLLPLREMFGPHVALGEEVATLRKPTSSGINYRSIADKMERLMIHEKVYTDPELTLDGLAARIGVSRHHLSESINQFIGKTFYQYVNEYRIHQVVVLMDECKEKKSAPNILSLAFEAGFHSKSSFNQYFKKVVGCTPSAYMKQMENSVQPQLQ